VRVRPGYGRQAGRAEEDVPDPEARRLAGRMASGCTIKDTLSNLPPETTIEQAAALHQSRWQVEQGYQQLKEELGLDHFEGRSWTGFHHHATMTLLAYGFLALERQRTTAAGPAETEDPTELPPFRRAGRRRRERSGG
jgi:SRSO17 transposase